METMTVTITEEGIDARIEQTEEKDMTAEQTREKGITVDQLYQNYLDAELARTEELEVEVAAIQQMLNESARLLREMKGGSDDDQSADHTPADRCSMAQG